jgi:hypothetical protein
MNPDLDPTRDEARQQLAAASQAPVASRHDRAIHAGATALLGPALGGVMLAMHHLSGFPRVAVSLGSWGLLIFAMTWVERRANASPLRAGRWARIGFGCSFLLSLVAVLPFLNQRAQEGQVTWPDLLAGMALVALPCLLAAARIWTDRR